MPQQKQMQFEVEYGFMQYENKVETTNRIHLLSLMNEKNLENVQKPSHKDHLLISAACIGKPP
jgi:hypothetical protein